MESQFPKTNRNKVKRIPTRGQYDQETIFRILDAGFICHVGFCLDDQPFVIPTSYGRKGNRIYLHGATTSRMLKALEKGIPVCLTVTHLDGLVLARSAYHHSMNYRSVVIFGNAFKVGDAEKETALRIISENIITKRWDEVRKPNAKELKATTVLYVEIEEASAKIRTGPPGDEKEDYDLDIWAGVIPIQLISGEPIADSLLKKGVEMSNAAMDFTDLK